MILRILILIIAFLFNTHCKAQKSRQETQMLIYNIGFNGITAGIGAVINKEKDEKWFKNFTKGFYQGCIGGIFIYSGKKLVYQINNKQNYWYGWPSKLVYSTGTSIVENAALNNKFGENWNIDIWTFRCNFSVGENSYFKTRLLITSVHSILFLIPKANMDWHKSAMTGTIVFSTESLIKGYNGLAIRQAIAVRTIFSPLQEYNEYYLTSHELVHCFQYREYQIFNTWFHPKSKDLPVNLQNIFSKYICLDISSFNLFYLTQKSDYNSKVYFKNFYELEAEHFARNKYIQR